MVKMLCQTLELTAMALAFAAWRAPVHGRRLGIAKTSFIVDSWQQMRSLSVEVWLAFSVSTRIDYLAVEKVVPGGR